MRTTTSRIGEERAGSEQLLAFLAGWLGSDDQASGGETEALARLARALGAAGAGLAGLFPHSVHLDWWQAGVAPAGLTYPWHEQTFPSSSFDSPRVLRQAAQAWGINSLQSAGEREALIWVFWPEGCAPQGCAPRPADLGLLPLVGAALLQRLLNPRQSCQWAQCFRQAAISRQLEKSARLAGKLAHDFGNVLTGVLGFAELAQHQLTSGSLGHQFVLEIAQSAQEGAAWIRKLQAFSRRVRPQLSTCHLAETIAQEERRFRGVWQGKVALLTEVEPDLPAAAIEAGQAQIIVAHLLNNAAEAAEVATPTNGSRKPSPLVALRARAIDLGEPECGLLLGQARPGRHVEITVEDNGPGLPEAVKGGKLDDAFIGARRRYRGLGLAVTYGILTSHGGGLCLSSTPGGGSSVRAYVPTTTLKTPRI